MPPRKRKLKESSEYLTLHNTRTPLLIQFPACTIHSQHAERERERERAKERKHGTTYTQFKYANHEIYLVRVIVNSICLSDTESFMADLILKSSYWSKLSAGQ